MKDAKGHGSDGRGGHVPGKMTPQQVKEVLNRAANAPKYGEPLSKTLDRWSGQTHVAQIAAQHKISSGPIKVQSLNTKLAGSPWQTAKRYGNRTVAERVAQHMRTDGHYVRVK